MTGFASDARLDGCNHPFASPACCGRKTHRHRHHRKSLVRLGWLLAMLLYVAGTHAIPGKFVDVKLFYSPNSAGSPIGTGKLYGLLLIQFIDLEIASQIATRDCFLK